PTACSYSYTLSLHDALPICILSCVVLTFGCSESLSPADIAGTYLLRRVANDTLPAVVYSFNGMTVRVIAETLQFTPNLRGRLSTDRKSTRLNSSHVSISYAV